MCQDLQTVFIFGYGSLIWRPGFSYIRSFHAFVRGFKRRFWQQCRYHRGTNVYPGRVVTLVQSEDEDEVVYGKVYVVSGEIAQDVIKSLDVREQGIKKIWNNSLGGYSREFVPVYTKLSEQVVVAGNAIVYVGTSENPEYVGPSESLEQDAYIIAKSVGPSGRNADYLFNLAHYLREIQVDDTHVFNLEHLVKQYMQQLQAEEADEEMHLLALSVGQRKSKLAQNELIPKGSIVIDHGACTALSNMAKSLRPVGIVQTHGTFDQYDVVWIRNPHGKHVAKAITNFSATQIDQIKGLQSKAIKHVLDIADTEFVIEHENMILL